jgi:hypothetical protein
MRITNEYNDLYKHWFKTIFPYFLWRYIPINIVLIACISMGTENNNYLSRVQYLYCSVLLVLSTFVMSSSCIISGLSFASAYCCCIRVVLYRKCSLFPLLCVSLFGLYFDNSYMIYIIRNPILWMGISAYEGGVFVSLFFDRRCSPDYFFRNVNKMASWIPDNKKR